MRELNAREEELHTAMAESATDYERLRDLQAELATLQSEREELEAAWLEAAELVDAAPRHVARRGDLSRCWWRRRRAPQHRQR